MPFVKRDADGVIIAVFGEATEDGLDEIAVDDEGLLAFMRGGGEGAAQRDMLDSDLGMVRVLEDLINLLIDKGVIRITDLPEAAQQKLLERGSLRDKFGYLQTLFQQGEGDEDPVAPDAKDFL